MYIADGKRKHAEHFESRALSHMQFSWRNEDILLPITESIPTAKHSALLLLSMYCACFLIFTKYRVLQAIARISCLTWLSNFVYAGRFVCLTKAPSKFCELTNRYYTRRFFLFQVNHTVEKFIVHIEAFSFEGRSSTLKSFIGFPDYWENDRKILYLLLSLLWQFNNID